jgi:hypothetical protein
MWISPEKRSKTARSTTSPLLSLDSTRASFMTSMTARAIGFEEAYAAISTKRPGRSYKRNTEYGRWHKEYGAFISSNEE